MKLIKSDSKYMKDYFATLLEEKNIDLDETFELHVPESVYTSHIMTYGVILEHIQRTSVKERAQIKSMLVAIDFQNRDVKHYLRHLGEAVALNY